MHGCKRALEIGDPNAKVQEQRGALLLPPDPRRREGFSPFLHLPLQCLDLSPARLAGRREGFSLFLHLPLQCLDFSPARLPRRGVRRL